MNRRSGVTILLCISVLAAPALAQDEPRGRAGFIGLRMTDLDDVSAEDLGLDSNRGVLILYVVPNSPAEGAGIQVNDVIRRFNGQVVDSRGDIGELLRQTQAGQVVTMTLIRQTRPVNVTLTLAERPREPARVRPELPN